jgi:hypothetical protein
MVKSTTYLPGNIQDPTYQEELEQPATQHQSNDQESNDNEVPLLSELNLKDDPAATMIATMIATKMKMR